MANSKNELTKLDENEVAVPSFLQEYHGATGSEDIDTDDLTIPRIKLCQAMTPEVQDGDARPGDFMVNVTGEILEQPLRFVPLAVGKEYILWNPERGQGILARAKRVFHGGQAKYLWDKQDETFDVKFRNGPKVTWKTKRFVEDNSMHKFGSAIPDDPESGPAATAHHNIVVALPDYDDMIVALSLSKSQEKRARDLNAMLKMSKLPIFARMFEVRAVDERSGQGDEYKNYKFSPAGVVQDAARFENYKAIFESFKDSGFNVDQSGEETSSSHGDDEKAF